MPLPLYLRSPADVAAAIQLGQTPEGLHLEFKAAVEGFGAKDGAKKEKQKELCRDVTQFANCFGGCLIIGILERNINQIKVAFEYKAVEKPDEVRQWIEDAIAKYCVPHTFSRDISIIDYSGGVLLAINIQPSRIPIIIWDREGHTMQAVTRNSHGKVYLNPDELERLRMTGNRGAKIAFEEARAKATERNQIAVEVVGGIRVDGTDKQEILIGYIVLGQVDENTFELRVPLKGRDVSMYVPYGLLRECWVDVQGRLTILLHLNIVSRGSGLTFANG